MPRRRCWRTRSSSRPWPPTRWSWSCLAPRRATSSDGRLAPHVTVASVVAREGRLLMVEERIRGELVLNQPAGHLEPGETPAEAAVREALEETGWDIRLD